MCCSYHPVSFVTISCNMKDPSSHLGGLICWLAMGAGLSRLELRWWKSSMLFSFLLTVKLKPFCAAPKVDLCEPLCADICKVYLTEQLLISGYDVCKEEDRSFKAACLYDDLLTHISVSECEGVRVSACCMSATCVSHSTLTLVKCFELNSF